MGKAKELEKDDESRRVTVYVAKDLVRMAKVIGTATGQAMCEVFEEILRPALQRKHREALTKLADLGDPGA